MSQKHQMPDDPDTGELADEADELQFQRLRKQSGKPLNHKDVRKQEAKQWGRMHNKFHKQRRRYDGNDKP